MEQEAPSTSGFDYTNHQFKVPTKKIDEPPSHEEFKKSEACGEILSFIAALS